MDSIIYQETEIRSAINSVRGMPFKWSLNPYQGCVHGCHYCYARRYHEYRELNASEDFTGIIFVKTNIEPVLRQELRRPGWLFERVAIGTATDPYQPIEGRFQLTRACLRAFADHGNPVGLVTKGTLIVRDVDVLAELSRGPTANVCFSLTTMDSDLWRKIEPGTPNPWQRLRAMKVLVEAGVRAGVLISPILPGLTDSPENLRQVVQAAIDHGAQFIGSKVLYLQQGTKAHYLSFLGLEYPRLLAEYRRLYPGPFAPKRFQDQLQMSVSELKESAGYQDRPMPESRRPRQLTLEILTGEGHAPVDPDS